MTQASFQLRVAVSRALSVESISTSRTVASRAAVCAITAYAALSPLLASAQENKADEKTMPTVKAQEDNETRPAVTQIGRSTQLLRDIPQTVTVLDRAVLEAQGATTLGDALRNVPGITLSAGEGGQIGDNVNLRGFSARTDLYVDGIRDRGQYSRETFFLEAVEVLKGPSSMLFGRGSTGGVINQVSKQPHARPSANVGATVGTDSYYRATVDVNQPISASTAFRVAAFAHSNESSRDIVESERYGIAPSLRFGMGGATEIVLSAIVQRRDDIPDYGFPLSTPTGSTATPTNPARPIDVDRDNFYGFTDDAFEQDSDLINARISHEFSPDVTLRNQTQFNSTRSHAKPTRMSLTATGASHTGRVGIRERLERDIDDRALYNQTDMIVKFGGGSLRHTVTTGIELGRDDYENQGYTTTGAAAVMRQTYDNPSYGPLSASAIVVRNTFTDNAADTLAAYANEQFDIGDHWKLIGGLRWDRFAFESKVTSNAGVVTTDTSKTDRMTSVRTGVVYQPDTIQTYYVSYGTSFNPSAETLTLSNTNQNIGPEKNRSFELGTKWSFADGGLLVTGALFRVEKSNARTTDPVSLVTTLDGEIRVQGLEFGISGKITAAWSMLAGYTYLDGEILSLFENGVSRNGNVLPNTPEHSASLWSTYALPRGWEIGGGLVYSDDRLLNNANAAITEGYTRVDATVAYIAGRYSVRLNLQNLTNEEYFEVASAARATPAQRRSALATFNWNF